MMAVLVDDKWLLVLWKDDGRLLLVLLSETDEVLWCEEMMLDNTWESLCWTHGWCGVHGLDGDLLCWRHGYYALVATWWTQSGEWLL